MTFQYEIHVFKELIEKYDSWEKLKLYLESEEGGMFRVIDKDESGFCLIRYEKGSSNMNLPHSKWFRSVVWNTIKNRPVCVGPNKTQSDELPYQTWKEIKAEGLICQEQVEGFMINCFKMEEDATVHITTRSKLNAAGTFYSKKTFRELFIESCLNTFGETEYSEKKVQERCHDLLSRISNDGCDSREISRFYSFVVQHIDHKIVKNYQQNRLYVIHRGIIYENGLVKIEDAPEQVGDLENIPCITFPNERISKQSYKDILCNGDVLEGVSEVKEWCKEIMTNKPREFVGMVWKDQKGNRWRVRNEKYSAIRSLRGNSPLLRDRFSQLYTSNLLHKYLEYYPEESFGMSICITHINNIIRILYELYVDFHIHKNKKLDQIDKMFHPHLYHLHGMYLSQLRGNGKVMTYHDVQVYIHKQPWQRISFLIRKHMDQHDFLEQSVQV